MIYMIIQLKLLKVVYSISWSFSSDTHWDETSEWRKASKWVDINLKFLVLFYPVA